MLHAPDTANFESAVSHSGREKLQESEFAMRRIVLSLFLISIALVAPSQTLSRVQAEQRAHDLLRQMTVEEKVGQLNQASGIQIPGLSSQRPDELIEQGKIGSILWLIDAKEINRLQHIAVERSRLHIPLIFAFDVIHGYRTVFPVPLAMASSWDRNVEEQAQRIAGQESLAAGIRWTFTPMVDIARDARWGRIVEGAGEDPYLGSAMARAQVRGFQGAELGSNSILTCVKHFAGYGAADGGRDYDSSYIPEVLLRNVYLEPFHAAEKQGAGSFMSAYMDLNDVPASGNRWLLTDILRNEWGFKGFVVTDASAVASLITHGYATDPADAAYKAFTAGVNMDMASSTFSHNLGALITGGKVTIAELDAAVLPILTEKYQLGLFDHPYADLDKLNDTLNRPESLALERKLAGRSMVLLKNANHVLPLRKSQKRVAVIGLLADSASDVVGGSIEEIFNPGEKTRAVTVLAGLKNKLDVDAQITFVGGPEFPREYPSVLDAMLGKKQAPQPSETQIAATLSQVKSAAAAADIVVAVMGEHWTMNSEAASRATLDLPGIQQQMLEAAVASGKPVVLVLLNGRPLDVRWATDHVSAILEAWYPGSAGGDAVADVLFGDVNPGGKLPVSWPRAVGQEPLYYNHNLTHEPEDRPAFKSRYWDLNSKPLYPFGYGLSYTTFKFGNLKVSPTSIKTDGAIEVSVDVTNTGLANGDAVVQLYIHQRSGTASRPVRQLKGFERVALAPGKTRTLKFPLGAAELEFWSPQTRSWQVEPAVFDVWAGEDSTAALHAEFTVTK